MPIAIEPSEVGLTGLVWLLLSYGYVLYFASNLIAQGSDLLLLVPSMAGLVGGVVLPLLGAVPDGAIVLFSGLGDIETAQETLSVGVGALAGSTIMLLTVPWGLSVYGGRVNLDDNGAPNYFGKPKLTPKSNVLEELTRTGVSVTEQVKHGGVIMMLTSIPYFLIQGPALFIHGPSEVVADGEHWWALGGMIVCLIGLFAYLYIQLQTSRKGMDKLKRVEVMKKLMQNGELSLAGALGATLQSEEARHGAGGGGSYQAVNTSSITTPPPEAYDYLKKVLRDPFKRYDKNGDGTLDKKEVSMFFRDFHESMEDESLDELFRKIDLDNDGSISFDEFLTACYTIIKAHSNKSMVYKDEERAEKEIVRSIFDKEDEEEEEVPEEFSDLSPDEQQSAIKKRAFLMLFMGTALVVFFSDPMVDVLQESANRVGISPFYVSFVLAPLASNASELLAAQYYAAKKTRKTISVSFTALEGAAATNNTFCLSIFMGLIYWRGLAWEYTAETIAILAVEYIMGGLVQSKVMTMGTAVGVLALFPLSIAFVALLEMLGFD